MYNILSYGIEHMFMTAKSMNYQHLNANKVNDKQSFIDFLIKLAVSKKFNDIGKSTINWSYDDTTQYISNMVTAFEHRFQHEHIDNPWEKIAEIMVTAAILE
jgi:predicted GNAT superfamily acetyltransferase